MGDAWAGDGDGCRIGGGGSGVVNASCCRIEGEERRYTRTHTHARDKKIANKKLSGNLISRVGTLSLPRA